MNKTLLQALWGSSLEFGSYLYLLLEVVKDPAAILWRKRSWIHSQQWIISHPPVAFCCCWWRSSLSITTLSNAACGVTWSWWTSSKSINIIQFYFDISKYNTVVWRHFYSQKPKNFTWRSRGDAGKENLIGTGRCFSVLCTSFQTISFNSQVKFRAGSLAVLLTALHFQMLADRYSFLFQSVLMKDAEALEVGCLVLHLWPVVQWWIPFKGLWKSENICNRS